MTHKLTRMPGLRRQARVIFMGGVVLLIAGLVLALAGAGGAGVVVAVVGFAVLVVGLVGERQRPGPPV
jgi:hypothetical protein